jgi:hypothetical protein
MADRTQRRSTDLAHALGDCVSGGEDLLGLPALSGLELVGLGERRLKPSRTQLNSDKT